MKQPKGQYVAVGNKVVDKTQVEEVKDNSQFDPISGVTWNPPWTVAEYAPHCGACGYKIEIDDRQNDCGKTWLQARDGTYLHASCWAAHPDGWEGRIDQSEKDA